MTLNLRSLDQNEEEILISDAGVVVHGIGPSQKKLNLNGSLQKSKGASTLSCNLTKRFRRGVGSCCGHGSDAAYRFYGHRPPELLLSAGCEAALVGGFFLIWIPWAKTPACVADRMKGPDARWPLCEANGVASFEFERGPFDFDQCGR